ncbi:MAG: hypothetical protein AAFZ15_20735, partial [Bacteroidota bacterium]
MNKTLRPLFSTFLVCLFGQLFSQNENSSIASYNYLKIDFTQSLSNEEIEELKRSGIILLEFIYPSSYIIAEPHLSDISIFKNFEIKSKRHLEAEDKLSSDLLNGTIPQHAIFKNNIH